MFLIVDGAEDQMEFSYDDDSEKGPARWGKIRHEWSMCNNGSLQSPIDLLDARVDVVSDLGTLQDSYRACNATLKNRGHDMMLKWQADAGYIPINGTQYTARQCHWHSPSEHTINGKQFDLELHLVHDSPNASIAVIGILYKIGKPDPFLTQMMDHLEDLSDSINEEKVIGMVDPKQIKIVSTKYYRYIGSLTTPPCTQDVLWTLVGEVRTVSKEQVKFLRKAVHDVSSIATRSLEYDNLLTYMLHVILSLMNQDHVINGLDSESGNVTSQTIWQNI
ncbi:putative carbonic anhydrase [Rosa chinensis]|uniref:Carbonic anhydrase n=1 Tax=Rosa chinensis TaxID=74649 RepID=A0A2P6QGJ3_ROSCH|nr:putative carbonic anhydrase [Rosa chinensis]